MAVQSQEYQEQFLQDLMTGYADSQRSAKEIFNERKEKVMKDGLDAHLTDKERLPRPTAALPASEKMPEFTKEVIPEETEEEIKEAADASTSATINSVFGDDVWSKRNQ
jgi:hypothetical protein